MELGITWLIPAMSEMLTIRGDGSLPGLYLAMLGDHVGGWNNTPNTHLIELQTQKS